MSETETDTPLSESEKVAATLAALEAERAARVEAGKWSRDMQPMLIAIPQPGETLQTAQQRALYEHLANHPDAPKTVFAYRWGELSAIDPLPQVELPAEQWGQPDAIDVTPPRRASPPSPPPVPRDEPLSYSNAGIPRREHERELKRLDRFLSGDWGGDAQSYPLRYPRGNRGGW
jgi:hypothetical protein